MKRLVGALYALLALPAGAFAQARPCIDMTADGVIDISDVTQIYRIAAGLEPGQDPRGDVDLDGQIDISDAVNAFLVASGQRFAVARIDPPAPAVGEEVEVTVVGLPEDAVVLGVVLRADGGDAQVRRVAIALGGGRLRFTFPDLAHLCPEGGCISVTLGIRANGQLTNFCPLAPLLPGERDGDRDTVPDQRDLCPQHFDPSNSDLDEDGVGDLCDNCPVDANPGQEDGNEDGSGDGCEAPRVVHIGGRVIEPEPGVDAQLNDPAVKHAVLVLTRDANDEILALLERSNIHVIEPIGRNVFMVGLNVCGMRVCPGFADLQQFPWLFAAFPLSPEDRLEAGLDVDPPEPFVLTVEFHGDVSVAAAEALLRDARAAVVSRGVEIGGVPDRGGMRRVNAWQVEGNADLLRMLARLDAVRAVSLDQMLTDLNDNTRMVVGIDTLNAAGLDGKGAKVMSVEYLGWANGDDSAPIVPIAGGPHPGLSLAPSLGGAVTVRDCAGCEGAHPYPAGCGGAVISAAGTTFVNHATHVAGIILGDGTLSDGMTPSPYAGMAPGATMLAYRTSTSPSERICERQDALQNFLTRAHNNSWGYCPNCAKYGAYNNFSRDYDNDIRLSPLATEVFSVGNDQDIRNTLENPVQCQGPNNPMPFIPPCALPPIYTAPACTALPPGVPPPPGIAQPAVNVRNRFFTIIGPGSTAKSTLTVGAVDSTPGNNRMTAFSSWGPTRDGRTKPEIVAPGKNIKSTCLPGAPGCDADGYAVYSGTSLAAPVVTGTIAVLNSRWPYLIGRTETVRALLAHTARDLGVHPGGDFLVQTAGLWPAFGGAADGPDFVTGYGLLDANAAAHQLGNGNLGGLCVGGINCTLAVAGCPSLLPVLTIPFESPTNIGGPGPVVGCPPMTSSLEWRVAVPAGRTHFKVTIAWNDPGSSNGPAAVVNDLDLVLKSPGGVAGYFYPWRLDPACPYLQAVRQGNLVGPVNTATYGDHRNTLEQVEIVGPIAAGTWKIMVSHSGLGAGQQPFSIMVTLE